MTSKQDLEHFLSQPGLVDELGFDDVRSLIARLESVPQRHEMIASDGGSLELHLFRRARELTVAEPERAAQIIWQFLCRRCVRSIGSRQRDQDLVGERCRELLVEWLDDYTETISAGLRAGVVEQLSQSLRKRATKSALWTASAIGFRDPTLLSRIRGVASKDNAGPIVDTALRVLAGLGPEDEEAHWISKRVLARVRSKGWHLDHALALRAIATPRLLHLLVPWWNGPTLDHLGIIGDYLLRVVAEVASSHPESRKLQTVAWNMLRQIGDQGARHRYPFAIGGDIASRCNSPSVPIDLMRWAAEEIAESGGKPNWPWYLFLLRASECVADEQTKGWRSAYVTKFARLALRGAASDPSGAPAGHRETGDRTREKITAWRTAARAQLRSAANWLDDALRNETNGFVQAQVLSSAMELGTRRLPASVRSLIAVETTRDGRTDNLASSLAAIEFAGECATVEAFLAVLNTGLHFKEAASQAAATSLTALAQALIVEANDIEAANLLFQRAGRPPQPLEGATPSEQTGAAPAPWQWSAAVAALVDVVTTPTKGNLAPQIRVQAETLVIDLINRLRVEQPDSFELGLLVAALPSIAGSPERDSTIALLIALAGPDSWVGWRIVDVLIRLDQIFDHPHVVHEVLGLVLNGDAYQFRMDRPVLVNRRGYRVSGLGQSLGLLFSKEPQRFSPAAATLVQTGDWETVAQFVPFVSRTSHSPNVVEALFERIRNDAKQLVSDLDSIAAIARADAGQLASALPLTAGLWAAESRSFAVRALCAKDARIDRRTLIEVLVRLTSDPARSVQLAALDELRLLDPAQVRSLARTLAKSLAYTDRVFAATAASYLASKPSLEVFQILRGDVERKVREAASRGMIEREGRQAADRALRAIKRTIDDRRRLVSLSALSDQLVQNADVGHLWRLRQLPVSRDDLKRQKRRLERRLEERLSKVETGSTQPAPQISQTIAGEGALRVRDGTIPTSYTVWRAAPTTSQVGRWGGTLRLPDEVQPARVLDAQTLVLQDGGVGSIVVVAIQGSMVSIAGNGPFPQGFAEPTPPNAPT